MPTADDDVERCAVLRTSTPVILPRWPDQPAATVVSLAPVWNHVGLLLMLSCGLGLGLGLPNESSLPSPFDILAQVILTRTMCCFCNGYRRATALSGPVAEGVAPPGSRMAVFCSLEPQLLPTVHYQLSAEVGCR